MKEVKMGAKGTLYLRIEYECNDESKFDELPWGINLDLRNEDFPDEWDLFDVAMRKWLAENGYAPILTNTEDVAEHLHGAKFKGYSSEYYPDDELDEY